MCSMKKLNAGTAIIATLFIVSGAIYAGSWQASLLAQMPTSQFDCSPIDCWNGEYAPMCDAAGNPINYFVDPCFKASAPEVCFYNDRKYEIGEKFKDSDDCNTCYCGENGQAACTKMFCPEPRKSLQDHEESEDLGECGLFVLCQGPQGMYEVRSCDATGNRVPDPCGSNYDFDDGMRPIEPEFEGEVITLPVMNRFNDVTSQTLEGEAANALAEKDIIGGFPDGSFRGSQPVNRAEAAKFLLMSRLGVKHSALNNGRFADVLEGEWYVKYVVTAADLGIIDGYKDGTFRPANTVNTAEFLKMLTGAFDLPQNIEHSFTDVPSDAWFSKYAGVADAFNLFPGRPEGKLQPERLLTRGEVSIAIYRILNAQ